MTLTQSLTNRNIYSNNNICSSKACAISLIPSSIELEDYEIQISANTSVISNTVSSATISIGKLYY